MALPQPTEAARYNRHFNPEQIGFLLFRNDFFLAIILIKSASVRERKILLVIDAVG